MRKVRVEICNIQTKTVNYLHLGYSMRKVRVEICNIQTKTVNYLHPSYFVRKVHVRCRKKRSQDGKPYAIKEISPKSTCKKQEKRN